MNPFTGSIDRKAYLIWNVAYILVYYAVNFAFKSVSAILIAFYIVTALVALLLVVRRLQNTGLNMWLLLALLLPIANLILIVALFFIPPKKPVMQSPPNITV